MEASSDIVCLLEIMTSLRDPDTGCPWDAVQTFASIAPYTIEEAYEVADAIERDDMLDLKEELGDLLLQVIYHSQLASERGAFSFPDVVQTITRKLIRRHPHVFGDVEARSANSAKGQWEAIKAAERADKALERQRMANADSAADDIPRRREQTADRLLDTVPANFPALTLALKVQQRAAAVGFDWADAAPIRDKLSEEVAEFTAAVEAGDIVHAETELGDILFTAVNLARYYEIDPELALRGCVRKFRVRFGHIEDRLAAVGRSLSEASLAEMEALWSEAKRL